MEACTDRIVRVSFAPDPSFSGRTTLAAAPKRCGEASWTEETTGDVTTISTRSLKSDGWIARPVACDLPISKAARS